ncbi:hypothetical protein R1flu_002172 [Riccia fluitans]|uniref:Dehydrin n=1 Tax=Riccia fluitans TaxID=41844 RepID=A0ABD1Y8A3_9MARC
MAGYLGGMIQQRRDEDDNPAAEEPRNPREFVDDPIEVQHIGGREPPTSQVGYGGGYHTIGSAGKEESGEGKMHGGRYVGGEGSSDQTMSDEKNSKPNYELCHSNSFPREAGMGEVPAGGYQEEGGCSKRKIPLTQKSQHYDESQPSESDQYGFPTPMRPPGAVLLDENHFDGPKYEHEPTGEGSTSSESGGLPEGEVRGGVPHGVVSGKASGAGQVNYGKEEVSGGPVGHQDLPAQEYQQTGEAADRAAYSQQYTQPHGPNEHTSQLEGNDQSPKPTGVPGSDTAPVAGEAHGHEKGGFISKIKNHLPGHHKHRE